jgi:hypothetical protein
METWRRFLKRDPLPSLLGSADPALAFFARRDLRDDGSAAADREGVKALWILAEPLKILKRQGKDGAWSNPAEKRETAVDYRLIEAWRNVRVLVQKYGLDRSHPSIEAAAEFVFSRQSPQGDFRGFLARQYATYYTGALLSILIEAGYARDPRTEKAFAWLLSMRQDDGGWSIPVLTLDLDRETMNRVTSQDAPPLEPDRSKPFSHHWTAMVLRAFAAHPGKKNRKEAVAAGILLKRRFFLQDSYGSYRAASYWLRFEYPFWWNNLVAAMDTLGKLGFTARDPDMGAAVDWLASRQEEDGTWKTSYADEKAPETKKEALMRPWVNLAICRVLKRSLG